MSHSILRLALTSFALLSFGCAGLSGSGENSPVLSRVVERGELRIGMSGNQPPLNVKNRAGELIGMEVDLARLLAGSMNVDPVFVEKPFGELLGALDSGEVDMVISGMTITPQRNLEVAFVGPYFVSGKSILTKSEVLATADEAGDIDESSITLAALNGSTSQRWVETFVPKANLVTTVDYDQGVEMVRTGRADAFVADFPICVLSVLRYPTEGLATLVQPLTVEPLGIALPAGDPLLLNLVDNYLNALRATGMLDQLQARWFKDGSWLADLP